MEMRGWYSEVARPTRLSCGGKEGVLQKEGSWEQGL